MILHPEDGVRARRLAETNRADSPIQWRYPSDTGRVDAVIVDYGTPALAEACLASLLKNGEFRSIATVDAKRLRWSYARSVNLALSIGDGDIVLALNADTQMLEPADSILALFDNDRTIGVVGPRQIDSALRITHGGIFGTNTRPEFRAWQQRLGYSPDTGDTRDAITVSGSVYFARRTVWEKLGGFLPTRHFYEETWLSYLARHRGYRVVYTGASTWLHEFNQSPTDPAWRARVAAESRETFRAACAAEGIECD